MRGSGFRVVPGLGFGAHEALTARNALSPKP